ncbi:hypothetical protein [Kutzneria sp. 744]|uniref:hypothetical protein n=1 Tax=Kutzneria sp. (strain 744) TaxID=345341 RepID=UPI0003EEACFE|nr:hypothetical protein [Kutzneria sp. 744]EWM17081.1 LigA protein [Kutzneria sp. 744]
MSDPFDVPERDLPEHVRQQALRRIMTEIGREPRARRRSGLVPVVIAASVVILMAGATVVTSAILGNKDHKVTNASPTTHAAASTTSTSGGGRETGFGLYNAQRDWGTGAEMERCWQADHKPDTWAPLLRVETNNVVALLYRVGTDIVFCQLTPVQVTVKSKPYPAPPTGNVPARLLFTAVEGTYAGVTAADVDNLVITPDQPPIGSPSAIGNGVFILPNGYRPTDHVTLRGFSTPDYTVPKADLPQPLTSSRQTIDQHAERTSAAGQRLAGCLSAANPPVADADYFVAGASVVVDDQHWAQLGKVGNSLVWCSSVPGESARFLPLPPTTHAITWVTVDKFGPSEIGPVIVGIAQDADAATVSLQPPGKDARTATVDHGSFIVTGLGEPVGGSNVMVKDSGGKMIEQFPI